MNKAATTLWYLIALTPDTPIVADPAEFDGSAWFPRREVADWPDGRTDRPAPAPVPDQGAAADRRDRPAGGDPMTSIQPHTAAVTVPYTSPVDCKLLYTAGDRVLLALRHGTGYADGQWNLPGKLDAGEMVDAAVCREAREEVGLHLEPAELRLSVLLHWRNPEGQYRLGVLFHVEADPDRHGLPVNAEPHKCAGIGWYTDARAAGQHRALHRRRRAPAPPRHPVRRRRLARHRPARRTAVSGTRPAAGTRNTSPGRPAVSTSAAATAGTRCPRSTPERT